MNLIKKHTYVILGQFLFTVKADRKDLMHYKIAFIHGRPLLLIIEKFSFDIAHCIHMGDSSCQAIFYIHFYIMFSNSGTLHLSGIQKYFSLPNFYPYSPVSTIFLLYYAYVYIQKIDDKIKSSDHIVNIHLKPNAMAILKRTSKWKGRKEEHKAFRPSRSKSMPFFFARRPLANKLRVWARKVWMNEIFHDKTNKLCYL